MYACLCRTSGWPDDHDICPWCGFTIRHHDSPETVNLIPEIAECRTAYCNQCQQEVAVKRINRIWACVICGSPKSTDETY